MSISAATASAWRQRAQLYLDANQTIQRMGAPWANGTLSLVRIDMDIWQDILPGACSAGESAVSSASTWSPTRCLA